MPEKTVPAQPFGALFQAQAHRQPARLAIKIGDTAWDYARLNRAANRIAHRILAARGEKQEAVAAMFDYSPSSVAAILGVFKTGKCLVLLPPEFPQARIEYMYKDSTQVLK